MRLTPLLLVWLAGCGNHEFSIDVSISPLPLSLTAATVNGETLVMSNSAGQRSASFHRDYAGGYSSIPSSESLVFQFSTADGVIGTIQSALRFCADRCVAPACDAAAFEHEEMNYSPSADFMQIDYCATCSTGDVHVDSCS